MDTTAAWMPSLAKRSRAPSARWASEPDAMSRTGAEASPARMYAPRAQRLPSPASRTVGRFWRVSAMTVGVFFDSSASCQHSAVSIVSAGRITCRPGMARSAARCSTG